MRKLILALGVMLCLGNLAIAQNKGTYADLVKRYVAQYRDLAMEEQKRSGVPASIKLAQGIHETVAGTSRLAMMAHNHFGIKCKRGWTGETFTHTDDAPDECFRKYSSNEASYRDHSDYLVKTKRYADLFTLDVSDYKGWAKGLKAAGYATNPRYAEALVKLIEEYHLQEYTYAAQKPTDNEVRLAKHQAEVIPEEDAPEVPAQEPEVVNTAGGIAVTEVEEPIAVVEPEPATTETASFEKKGIQVNEGERAYPPYGEITWENGLKAIYAREGDTPLEYALKFDIRYERLLELNDISDKPMPFDMFLYLERKHFNGSKPTRTLKEGESLLQIAQEEGIQLKFLRAMNLLEPGEVPVPGTSLELQHRALQKPVLVAGTEAQPKIPEATVVKEATPDVPAEAADMKIVPAVVTAPVATEPSATITEATAETKAAEVVPVAESSVSEDEQPIEEAPPADVADVAVPTTPIASAPVAEVTIEREVANAQANVEDASIPATEAPIEVTPVVPVQPVASVDASATPAADAADTKPEEKAPVETDAEFDELAALKAKFDRFVYSSSNQDTTKTALQTENADTAATTTADNKAREEAQVAGKPTYHVVKKGETAFGIAKRYNISMKELMNWNGLDFDKIKVGQKLIVKP